MHLLNFGLFFPVVCFIRVFDRTLAEQVYCDKGLLRATRNAISHFHNHALKVTVSGGARRNKSFQSLVFVLTQLHSDQWSSFPFSLPSLIVIEQL